MNDARDSIGQISAIRGYACGSEIEKAEAASLVLASVCPVCRTSILVLPDRCNVPAVSRRGLPRYCRSLAKKQIIRESARGKKTRLQPRELQAGFREGFMKGYEPPARPSRR